MDNFSEETVRKIWQRVQQSHTPPSERPDLCAMAQRELSTAAIYDILARRIPGSSGRQLGEFARRERSHAASIKGICAVTYGKCPPIPITAPGNAATPVLLRRCYGLKQQAVAQYEKLSENPDYGSIFRQLGEEEHRQLIFLLQLLGSLKQRRKR